MGNRSCDRVSRQTYNSELSEEWLRLWKHSFCDAMVNALVCSNWVRDVQPQVSLATMGSVTYRYVYLSSLTPGRDVLKNNADLLTVIDSYLYVVTLNCIQYIDTAQYQIRMRGDQLIFDSMPNYYPIPGVLREQRMLGKMARRNRSLLGTRMDTNRL